MYIILFILCASPSLLNPLGVFPLWLLFSFVVCFLKKYSFSLLPPFRLFSLSYLLLACFSFLVNISQAKVGHVLAYFLFFCYYLPFFISVFRKSHSLFKILLLLRICSFVAFATVAITCLFDYLLLVVNIDYSDFIPVHSNIPVMSSFTSRPRGFFAEPTEAAMALNSFIAIFLASDSTIRRYFSSIQSSFFINTRYLFLAYVIIMFLCRSAASFASIILSLAFAFLLDFFLKPSVHSIPLKFSKSLLFSFGFLISALSAIIFRFHDYILSTTSGLLLKIFLDADSASAVARSSAWVNNFSYFLNESDITSFLSGFGPGHVSYYASLGILQGSTNWYLDILIGFGIIGLLLYICMFFTIIFKSLKLISPFRFWYFVAIFYTHIHLFTMTSFYHPPFPFLISIVFLPQLRKQS